MQNTESFLLDNGKIDLARVKNGILLLTFDDGRFETWLPHLELFDRFNAHATFFYDKEITAECADSMKQLRARGHSVGFHSTTHKDAVDITPEAYYREYIRPQVEQAEALGVRDIAFFAYPNNRHSEEFDRFLSRYFARFRAGTGIKAPKGYWIADFEEPYVALEELPGHRVMGGCGIGPFYETTQENLDAALEKAARENKAVTFFSHAILSEAKTVHMASATLEAMLEKAAELGMMIAGFSELP
ncbi:MAG: polysaccharide deacetylase family protein [Lentisphaeria bacterium]|nr:polysaccharide deacetylase family protein [Lentisphaeria bacterium]